MRAVLIGIYVIAMVAALVVGLGIYKGITANNTQAKIYIQKLQDTKSLEYMLDLAVDKTVDNSLEIVLNREINSILKKGDKLFCEEITTTLDQWLINNQEVSSVHIVNLEEEVLTRGRVSISYFSENQFINQFAEKDLQRVRNQQGEPCFGIAANMVNGMNKKRLFFARRINNFEDLGHIGYLFIFFDEQALLGQIMNYVKENKFEVILADNRGNYINLYNGSILGEMLKAYTDNKMLPKKRLEWESKYHHVEMRDKMMGLRIIADKDYTYKDDNIINIVIAILLINLIFLSVGTLIVKKIVVYPLEKITNKAKKITEEADLTIRFDEESGYAEVGVISQVLNNMLVKIDQLIRENRKKEKQRRMLELSVVNHQVNPHFLFNTLNSVNVLIAMEDKETALKLVASLAKYYRACLAQEETINTVQQEEVLTKEYINIMQLKSPGLLQVSFEVDECLYPYKVPGMILQTLIENAIKYGIKTIEEPLKIDVKVKEEKEQGRMAFSVRDNGKGIAPEICEKLINEQELKRKSGFGLKGTIKRIRLMYNVTDVHQIIKIDSKLDEYAEVTIYIPLK